MRAVSSGSFGIVASLDQAVAYSNIVFGGSISLWLLGTLTAIVRGTGLRVYGSVNDAVFCVSRLGQGDRSSLRQLATASHSSVGWMDSAHAANPASIGRSIWWQVPSFLQHWRWVLSFFFVLQIGAAACYLAEKAIDD
jgi:hypothetical protein